MKPRVTIVVGNPKPKSRTLLISELLVRRLFGPDGYQLNVIDLADHTDEIFRWPSAEMTQLNDMVASSDFAVIASPTYKATYTGLLKAFLDRYAANGLRGVVALPVMTGANMTHSMATTVNLSPLLVELGASVPFRGFYFAMNQMDRAEEVIEASAEDYLATHRALQTLLQGWTSLGHAGSRENA